MLNTPLLSTILLLPILLAISVQDIRKGIIPNSLVLGTAILGILHSRLDHGLSVLILGGIGYSLYKLAPRFMGEEGFGFGDVKMMAACGFWLPLTDVPLFLILTGAGGVLTAFLWATLKKGPRFPLGPALALALGILIFL